jgi:hypothetical protein
MQIIKFQNGIIADINIMRLVLFNYI